ncbi:MAG TPA: hypothetical protein ENK57_10980 [Polyangiaceae bacterium]|nr:hypothetical protein [Polyangiaceae bacterium]
MTVRATATLLVISVAVLGCDDAPTASTSPSASIAVSSSALAVPPLPEVPRQADVDAVIAAERRALSDCLATHHRGEGGVELQLIAEIDGDGRVKDATVAGGGAALRPLRRCVSEKSRSWRFPRSRQGGTVTASVQLGSRSGQGGGG